MPIPIDAPEVLNREFLEIRARLLQVAASLDRIDRASGDVDVDPRLEKLRRALVVLQDPEPNRAEQLQLIFSRPYEKEWQTKLGVKERR